MGETYHAAHNQYDECISQCLPLVNLLDFRLSALVPEEEKQTVDERKKSKSKCASL